MSCQWFLECLKCWLPTVPAVLQARFALIPPHNKEKLFLDSSSHFYSNSHFNRTTVSSPVQDFKALWTTKTKTTRGFRAIIHFVHNEISSLWIQLNFINSKWRLHVLHGVLWTPFTWLFSLYLSSTRTRCAWLYMWLHVMFITASTSDMVDWQSSCTGQ